MGYSNKFRLFGRKSLFAALIFILSGMAGMGTAQGKEETASPDVSGQGRADRSEEIKKALEKADGQKAQQEENAVTGDRSSSLTRPNDQAEGTVNRNDASSAIGTERTQAFAQEEAAKEGAPKAGVPDENETTEPVQGPEGKAKLAPEEPVSEPVPEESRFEYTVLENFNWETSEKKLILRLLISGEGTPSADVIRDLQGMTVRLKLKGLATRMPRALSGCPPGVQSFSIQEDPKMAKVWGLEAPYYAVDEILIAFTLPVQYSVHQEPGVLKVTFTLPKKIEPKKIEPATMPSIETIVNMQREALALPETTRGTSAQSESQLESRVLYGALKPPSIADLYRKELESAEFKATSGLPDNVRPLLESRHPPFGTAEYFKKYIHGSIRQTFNFASNYNQGTTSAFQESDSRRAAPERGKNIGNIIATPSVALLFYRPGEVDVSAGYSANRDFPTTNNNFLYGLNRQNINLGMSRVSNKRYAFTVQNNLRLFGGMTRQKFDGKWVKAPWQTQHGYQLDNRAGLNYRMSKRLLWGSSAGMSRSRSETNTPGGRSRNLLGDLSTYLKYRMTPRLDLLLGTDFTHVFKDTSGRDSTSLEGPRTIITTKGKNVQSVYVSADYRYSKKITLKGTLQSSLIDWDIPKLGGAVRATYQRTPHDDLSLQFTSSIIQNNTNIILSRSANTSNSRGILLERFLTLGLKYNRQFDHGKLRGSLEVMYIKNGPLSGVYYGRTTTDTINYDIRFIASIRRALFKQRAWLGLLYSYEYAPNSIRNYLTGIHDRSSNTSQNIIATMEYQF